MKSHFLIWGLILFTFSFLVRCGSKKEGGTGEANPPIPTSTPQSSEIVAVLTLFAGYPCASCNTELPAIRDRLKTDLGDKAARVHVRVYVVADKQWKPSNAEVAKRYGQDLNVPFEMLVDNRCKDGFYKSYYDSEEDCKVPAGAIEAKDGSKKIIYAAGKLTIDKLFEELKARVQ